MPGSKQAWPTTAACWSPAMPRIGTSRHQIFADRSCPTRPRVTICAPQDRWHAQQPPVIVVPFSFVNIEKEHCRDALVASVACAPTVRQAPDQETIDRAECEFATLGARAYTGGVQNATQSRCRRNKDQAGVRSLRMMLSCPAAFSILQASAVRLSCQTIARCDRFPGSTIPYERGFPLIGDAEARSPAASTAVKANDSP